MQFDEFKAEANAIRGKISELGAEVKALREKAGDMIVPLNGDRGEAIANLMLAYRHCEDMRMRLGKSIQAVAGGVSIYDHEKAH